MNENQSNQGPKSFNFRHRRSSPLNGGAAFTKGPAAVAAEYEKAIDAGMDANMESKELRDQFKTTVIAVDGLAWVVAVGFETKPGTFSVVLFMPFDDSGLEEHQERRRQLMIDNRLSQGDVDDLHSAFALQPDCRIVLLDPVVETMKQEPDNPLYMCGIFSAIVQRLWNEKDYALYESTGAQPLGFMADAIKRNLMFSLKARKGNNTTFDLMSQPIRDDIILTLFVKEPGNHRNAHEINARDAKIALLSVVGYIDFKLAPASVNPDKPWGGSKEVYVPEFIITSLQRPEEEISVMATAPLQDIQANLLALVLVSNYMASGNWVESFGDGFAVAALLPELPNRIDGDTKYLQRIFNEVLQPGFMVSIDVNRNAVTDYSSTMFKHCEQSSDALNKHFLPFFYDSVRLTENESAKSEMRMQPHAQHYTYPFAGVPYEMPMGYFKTVKSNLVQYAEPIDVRSVDFLSLLNLYPKDRSNAIRFADSLYVKGVGGAQNHLGTRDVNYEARKAILMQETDVTWTGSVRRYTLQAEFLRDLSKMVDYAGMRIEMDMPERKRQYIDMAAIFTPK